MVSSEKLPSKLEKLSALHLSLADGVPTVSEVEFMGVFNVIFIGALCRQTVKINSSSCLYISVCVEKEKTLKLHKWGSGNMKLLSFHFVCRVIPFSFPSPRAEKLNHL